MKLILISILFASTSAFAANPFFAPSIAKIKKSMTAACADFSGNWKGVCNQKNSNQEGDIQIPMEISIEMTCSEIYIGNTEYKLDGIQSTIASSAKETSTTQTKMNWTQNNSVIEHSTDYSLFTFADKSTYAHHSSGVMYSKDGTLFFNSSSQNGSMNCELSKAR